MSLGSVSVNSSVRLVGSVVVLGRCGSDEMSVRTRKQKTALVSQQGESQTMANGNGTIHKSSPRRDPFSPPLGESKENIFLFYPNIIGRPVVPVSFFLSIRGF